MASEITSTDELAFAIKGQLKIDLELARLRK